MSQLAFAIRGEGSDTLEIDVYDDIGESWWGEGVSAKSVRKALRDAAGAKNIKLRVNSRGGDVFDGFAIYNLLRDHPARVEADVDALAASMASVILMAADEIRVAQGSMVMIHNPWSIAIGDAEEMRSTAEVLDKIRGQIADAYVARTGQDLAQVIDWMDAETWLTAEEAVGLGFADTLKGATKARALAALDLRGLERTPQIFASAIAAARRALARPEASRPRPSAAAATEREPGHPPAPPRPPGRAQEKKNMNIEELRAQHPELHQAVFDAGRDAGVEQERKRVRAHLKLAASTGAVEVAHKAIESGASVTDEEVHADYLAAGLNRRDRGVRQLETDAAGKVLEGANAPVEQPKDLGDQVVAVLKQQGGA